MNAQGGKGMSEQRQGGAKGSWGVLMAFLALTQIGLVADNILLTNAMSAIAGSLHATVSDLQIANLIYPLISAPVMVAAGILGGALGWRTLLIAGLAIVVVAETLASVSTNIHFFNYAARTLVGVGAGLCIPAVLGYITDNFSRARMATSFALISASVALSAALAPVGSGFVVMYLSWQAGFLMLAGLFVLCLLGFFLFAPREAATGSLARFDVTGFILLFAGLTTVLLALSKASAWGVFFANSQAPFSLYHLSPCLFLVLAGVAVLFFFMRYEQKRERTYGKDAVLLRCALLTTPGIRAGLFMTGFYYYLAMGAAFILVLYLQIVLKYDAVISGVIFAVVSVGMIAGSLLTPKFGRNVSLRGISLAGIALSIASTLLIVAAIGPDGFSFWLYVGSFFMGVGSGMVTAESPCAVTTAIEDAFHDKQLAGQSSGAQGAARNVGQALGLALAGLALGVGLTTFTRTEILKNKSFPPSVDNLSRMVDSMAFVVDDNVRAFLKKRNIEEQYVEEIVAEYNKGRIFSVRASLLLLAVGGALFLFPAMSLTRRKLKDMRD